MLPIGLVGLGAGAAAALLFAAISSGTYFSVPLFYIAPLPIMIAGLGWSHWSALIAAVLASAALGAVFGGMFFLAFLAGVALPAWWLTYLAMLARPGNDAAGTLDWYPPGQLVIWAAVLASVVVIVAILNVGTDIDGFRTALTAAMERMFDIEPLPADPSGEVKHNVRITLLVTALPPAAAVIATITSVFNLWLAARIVAFSGRLTRPWPALPAMAFPKLLLGALVLAVVVSFIRSLVGIAGGVVSSSILMAYGVLGFAVLHSLTRQINGRPFVLGGIYASVMVFGWPILALCLLGISESAFDLRARAARKRGPPARL
jgi:hypothetical protein